MTEWPRPERETSRRQLVQRALHLRRLLETGCVCRIRIFVAPDQVPVVVATELDDNRGTSVTNMTEYLAAEIIARHFPEQFEAEEHLIWLEEYPRTPEQRSRGMPAFSQAEFSSYTPRVEYLGTIKRIHIGQPTWHHLEETEVEALIGILQKD